MFNTYNLGASFHEVRFVTLYARRSVTYNAY